MRFNKKLFSHSCDEFKPRAVLERNLGGRRLHEAADLMKFAGALMSNKLLKAETLAEATRPQFTTGAYGSEGRTRRGPMATAAALRE